MGIKKYIAIIFSLGVWLLPACEDYLNPEPVNLLIDDLALNEPGDVNSVEIGLYARARGLGAPTVIAGDMTADMLIHNGTFNQYRELGSKEITPSNAAATTLWGSVYGTVYSANFVLERLPDILGVPGDERQNLTAVARFLRGYAYFIGVYTYGDIPLVTTTDIETNRSIPRANRQEVLDFVLDDYLYALENITEDPVNAGFVGLHTVEAALARFHLYRENWQLAEDFASRVIDSEAYELVSDYGEIVNEDFTDEAIFEFGYSIADDPGTDANRGLNDLFIGRREIIPSNQAVFSLNSEQAGDRWQSLRFNIENLGGDDNGWSVNKYGNADADNNNIVVFRLAEMYLIRAEARARRNNLDGAVDDLNVLRIRANAPEITNVANSQQLLLTIENERLFELAYEGHRWYDLVRTGRINTVMQAFSPNWKQAYELWPIPLREIQNNPALIGQQNPGY